MYLDRVKKKGRERVDNLDTLAIKVDVENIPNWQNNYASFKDNMVLLETTVLIKYP